ncbi:MAG: transposase [Acidimicrobiia bacterium]
MSRPRRAGTEQPVRAPQTPWRKRSSDLRVPLPNNAALRPTRSTTSSSTLPALPENACASSTRSTSPGQAETYLRRWCRGAVRSRLEPIQRFARTVVDHWEGILRWHHKRINNGILEAINSLAAKRRARGYRSSRNLIAMTYLIAGKLHLGLTHTK